MAFPFGSPAPAPAPSSGSGGGFSFGTAAPAPSTGGFSFGAATGPAAAIPAPAPASGGGFGFSGAAAAPAGGFSFGGTPAASPGTSAFGGGFSFASTPASASGFSFGSSGFDAAQPQQQRFGPPPTPLPEPHLPAIAGSMLYKDLPPQYKADIDSLYNMIRQHQRTMEHVKTMAPHSLVVVAAAETSSSADLSMGRGAAAATSPSQMALLPPLARTANELYGAAGDAGRQLKANSRRVEALSGKVSELHQQVLVHAKWPLEAVAIRRGVRLSHQEEKKQHDGGGAVGPGGDLSQDLLDSQLQYVDRVERMPSPLLWEWLKEWERRAEALHRQTAEQMEQLNAAARAASSKTSVSIETLVRTQHSLLVQTALRVSQIQREMEGLRRQYAQWEILRGGGENVLLKAEQEEFAREQRWNDVVLMKYVEAVSAGTDQSTAGAPPPAPTGPPATANLSVPSTGFSFSGGGTGGGGIATPAPAPASGLLSTGFAPAAAAPSAFATTPSTTNLAVTGTTPALGFASPGAAFPAASPTAAWASAPSVPGVKKKSSSSSRSSSRLRR